MSLDSNNYILEKYLEYAFGTYKSGAYFSYEKIMVRCPICQDKKKRAYILKNNPKDRGRWVFTCFNGGCVANDAIKATNFLKIYFPGLYEDYRKEVFSLRKWNREHLDTYVPKQSTPEPEEKKINEKNDTKHFIPINKGVGPLFDKAREYCKGRKIPTDIWNKWFVSTGGRYEGRLIIPFYDNDGLIYYYQGRTLIGQEPKYLNRRTVTTKEIYNIHNIDRSKPVMVTEGPIDSMFLENAIATLGVKHSEKILLDLSELKCYYVFDNDKDGRRCASSYLEDEKWVFNWDKFLRESDCAIKPKDINDYILVKGISKLTFSDLQKYFTKNVYDKVWFT